MTVKTVVGVKRHPDIPSEYVTDSSQILKENSTIESFHAACDPGNHGAIHSIFADHFEEHYLSAFFNGFSRAASDAPNMNVHATAIVFLMIEWGRSDIAEQTQIDAVRRLVGFLKEYIVHRAVQTLLKPKGFSKTKTDQTSNYTLYSNLLNVFRTMTRSQLCTSLIIRNSSYPQLHAMALESDWPVLDYVLAGVPDTLTRMKDMTTMVSWGAVSNNSQVHEQILHDIEEKVGLKVGPAEAKQLLAENELNY